MLTLHYFLAEPSTSFVMSQTIVTLFPRCLSVTTDMPHSLCLSIMGGSDTTKRTRSGLLLQALHATTGRHETNVCYRNLYGAVDELGSKSGNWPRSCGAPVWGVALQLCLCCSVRPPRFPESTRPFASTLNVLATVMWLTRLFCFHTALLLSMSVVKSFDPALTPLDAVKASTATCNFPCCSEFVSELVIWYLVCREC